MNGVPFFGSWKKTYWAVVIYLVVVIAALMAFTASFKL